MITAGVPCNNYASGMQSPDMPTDLRWHQAFDEQSFIRPGGLYATIKIQYMHIHHLGGVIRLANLLHYLQGKFKSPYLLSCILLCVMLLGLYGMLGFAWRMVAGKNAPTLLGAVRSHNRKLHHHTSAIHACTASANQIRFASVRQ